MVAQLTQAISIATGANNGTLNSSQLQSISNQLSGIRDDVTSLANTSYQGKYIFGGSQTSTLPFTTSNATAPATISYNGDHVANYLKSPNGQTIQLNMPGNQIFPTSGANSAFQALNSLIAYYSTGAPVAISAQDTQLSTLPSITSHSSESLLTIRWAGFRPLQMRPLARKRS